MKIELFAVLLLVVVAVLCLTTLYLEYELKGRDSRIETLEMYLEFKNDTANEYRENWISTIDSLVECRNETAHLEENCIWECPTYPFAEAAREVAEAREYDRHMYNCADYTDDLVLKLKGLGYEAYEIWGHSEWGYHAYTKLILYIESTTGEVLDPVYYFQNYGRFAE